MDVDEMLSSFAYVATLEAGRGNEISEEFFDEALKVTANASLLKALLSDELGEVKLDINLAPPENNEFESGE